MRVLLDENLEPALRRSFPSGWEAQSVKFRGWTSFSNGELLAIAAEHGFQACVTADKTMEDIVPKPPPFPVLVLPVQDAVLARQLIGKKVVPLLKRGLGVGSHYLDKSGRLVPSHVARRAIPARRAHRRRIRQATPSASLSPVPAATL